MSDLQVFSSTHPEVRLVWDSLSLSAYMADPLTYYYKHVRGWRESETEGVRETGLHRARQRAVLEVEYGP